MKYLSFLLVLFMTRSVFAEALRKLTKDDANAVKIGLAVQQQVHPDNKDKLVVIVKVMEQVDKQKMIGIYLKGAEKSQKLTPEKKDGVATVTFEIDKKALEEGSLFFGYTRSDGIAINCGTTYTMYFKDWLVDKAEEK